jgi:hypothetical protein
MARRFCLSDALVWRKNVSEVNSGLLGVETGYQSEFTE